MGMFDFGGSTQSSSSYGQSSSQDESSSIGVSGGLSEQGSQSTSTQGIAFEDIFQQLFGGAAGTAMNLDPSMLTDMANQLFSGGLNFMEGLGGGAGADYLESRLSGDNAVLEEQIDLLGEDLGNFFNEQLLPGITSEAVGGGALGGGRQGVAQGEAANMVGEQFRRGATALRAGDIAARDAAATSLEGLAIQGAGTGLQALPAMAGLAEMGFGAEMMPYMMLAQITGDPTVLTQAQSSSYGSAADFAMNFSESFGSSQSTSSSESSGKSINFGWG